jgi:hypothetical protein
MTARDTVRLTSFLLRIFWYLWPVLTGKAFRLDEVNSDPRVRNITKKYVETFLPELKRMTGKCAK